MDRGAGKKTAGKIVTVGVGLLLIAVLTLVGKFFMRGFFVGAAVTFVAIVGVLIWMSRSTRGGGG
jgi:hypothetical protein